MLSSGERRAALVGWAALTCVGAGAAAGLDAGKHIDAFYTTRPAPHWQAAAVITTPAAGADVAIAADYPVAVSHSPAWASDADANERAFFGTDVRDDPDDDEPQVRVHRGNMVQEDGLASDVNSSPEPALAGDDAGNGVEPVAPGQLAAILSPPMRQ